MSFFEHGKGYLDPRTLFHVDSLYAWKHNLYFPPVVVEINPTSACNQKCRYCYAHGRTTGKLKDDVLVNVMTQIAQAGSQAVVFQGTGEPLLHRALPDAIHAGAMAGLAMSITTNGVLLDRAMQQKILPHLRYIKFSSLDSNAARYAFIHGCPEQQWHKTIENIRTAVEIRERDHLEILYLATLYLTKENFPDAFDIVHYLKGTGLDYVSVQEAVYSEYSWTGPEPLASSYFTPEEIEAMKERVMVLNDPDFRVNIRFPLTDESFINGLFKDCWQTDWCQGLYFNTLINSDGDVYPCFRCWGAREFRYGSIYEQTFEEIWKSPRRIEIIETLNHTPPLRDECSICNVTKTNEVLRKLNDNSNVWRRFLI